jgi:heat shock protein HtpX
MALFMGVGYFIGGSGGAVIAFVVAALTNFFAYWKSDRLVLLMHGAHEVDEHTEPELVHIVAELAECAGLPMPRFITSTSTNSALISFVRPDAATRPAAPV